MTPLTPGAPRPVPPPWSPRLPRRLAGVAVVVALLGIGSAATRTSASTDEPTERPSAAGTTSSTSDDTVVEAPTTETGAVTTAGEQASSTSDASTPTLPGSAATPGAPTPTPIEPGPVVLPAPGRYEERVVHGDGSTSAATLVVSTAGQGRRRLSEGGDTDRLLAISDGDGFEELTAGRGDAGCDWSPAAMVVPPRLTDGATWVTDATCTTRDGTTDVTRHEEAVVRGRARTTVGDERVDCWLIERRTVTTSRLDAATVVVESVSTELFAPSLGLPVYRTSRTDIPRADGTVVSVLLSTEVLSTP